MKSDAKFYIDVLNLQPHPEGGWYREVYRSRKNIPGNDSFPGGRSYCTSIYFLLTAENFSAFHKIKSDEIWHFYAGDPLEIIEINKAGTYTSTLLGSDISSKNHFQHTVAADNWFGSRVKIGGTFSLVGCTVAPGFDFNDFEMADRHKLLQNYSELEGVIKEMTRV